MNDRPNRDELLEAVARFLSDDVVAALDGHLKFQARVAANVLRIVGRELELESGHVRGEWDRLNALLGEGRDWPGDLPAARDDIEAWTRELSGLIRAGEADAGPTRDAVLSHLRETVADKLEVAKGDRRLSVSAER